MEITGQNFIGNKRSSSGTIVFSTFNPLLNEMNSERFYEATQIEVDEAVELAQSAFEEFRKIGPERKTAFLEAIADEIVDLGDDLLEMYVKESGLTVARAKVERTRTVYQLTSYAAVVREGSWVDARIDTAIPDRTPVPKPDLRKMSFPIGPIVVFGASNFPLAYSTAGGDTASAFAAGCPVIVKSHPMHAGTGELVAGAIIRAAEKTGMPNGVFSNLNSRGIEVGQWLAKHPGVKGIGFTGSIRGGRALFDLANQREEPIPVFAEMGSTNPVVILPEYLRENKLEIAKMYATSITNGAGQFCTNPGVILGFKGEDLNDFAEILGKEVAEIQPGCMLHPEIHRNFQNGKMEILETEGVKVVNETNIDQINFGNHTIATVDGATYLSHKQLHREVFGPFSMIVKCEDKTQLLQVLDHLEGQLTGTIMAAKAELIKNHDVLDALQQKVGRVIFNGVPTGVEVCPSMHHGGPYPASTDSRFTAVGSDSIRRWVRPISFQNCPAELLPKELRNDNPLGILRVINGVQTKEKI